MEAGTEFITCNKVQMYMETGTYKGSTDAHRRWGREFITPKNYNVHRDGDDNSSRMKVKVY